MNGYEEIMTKRYGERYVKYREILKSRDIESCLDFPLHIDLDLVDACNLKCPTCHSIGRDRLRKPMDEGTLLRVISEFGEHDLPSVNIGGCGEPLVDTELTLRAMCELKKTSVMDIFLHTNGVLLNEDHSKSLIGAGLTYLCVSVDAVTQEVYGKMRDHTLSGIIRNVENFLSLRSGGLPALRVSFLATAVNIHEKDRFIDFWKDKADVIDIQNYHRYYDVQPDVRLKEKIADRQPVVHRMEKRMAVTAPEYLCVSCSGVSVSAAIKHGDTLSKYETIKNYWDNRIIAGVPRR